MRIEDKLGFIIHGLDNMLLRNLFMHLKAYGLDEATVMHSWILKYLDEHQDTETFQKDLEAAFSCNRSTVTNILQLMEKKGYISREAVERDARLKRIILEDKGYETLGQLDAMSKELAEDTLRGISAEDLQTFYDVADKLKANLEAQRRDDND